jgi:hypothetical protein
MSRTVSYTRTARGVIFRQAIFLLLAFCVLAPLTGSTTPTSPLPKRTPETTYIKIDGLIAHLPGKFIPIELIGKPTLTVELDKTGNPWLPNDATSFWTFMLVVGTVLLAWTTNRSTNAAIIAEREQRQIIAAAKDDAARTALYGVVEATATRLALLKANMADFGRFQSADTVVEQLVQRVLQPDIAHAIGSTEYVAVVEAIVSVHEAFASMHPAANDYERLEREAREFVSNKEELIVWASGLSKPHGLGAKPIDAARELYYRLEIEPERTKINNALESTINGAIKKINDFRESEWYTVTIERG